MGYETWHNYGYGICVSELCDIPVERLGALLHCAPHFASKVQDWLNQRGIDAPSYSDYMAYDQLFMLGLATFLAEVIEEAEHLLFTACDSHDGDEYLVYMPSYPWNLREHERDLTEERIQEILSRYVSILSDKPLTIAYRSIENGS